MRWSLSGAAFVAGVAFSSVAYPRLLGESIQGTQKICVYDAGGQHTPATSSRTRTLRLGLGQRCPTAFPGGDGSGMPPPSAMLQSETVDGAERLCIYEQLGYVWRRTVSIQSYCPPAAGMIPKDDRPPAGRR